MMETSFRPGAGMIRGAMIGLASAGLLLANGNVSGISGLLGRSMAATPEDRGWRIAFLVGLPFASWFVDQWMPVELEFAIPTRTDLDGSLLGGAAIFSVGWGLVGLCPGPALANLYRGSFESVIFVGAMITGVVGFQAIVRLSGRQD
jgi:uncharacterized membrane protein YedE/YeeE